MPKYYCDYCDMFLTHDSPSVRKTHLEGKFHRENYQNYYLKVLKEQAQKMVNEELANFNHQLIMNPINPLMSVPYSSQVNGATYVKQVQKLETTLPALINGTNFINQVSIMDPSLPTTTTVPPPQNLM